MASHFLFFVLLVSFITDGICTSLKNETVHHPVNNFPPLDVKVPILQEEGYKFGYDYDLFTESVHDNGTVAVVDSNHIGMTSDHRQLNFLDGSVCDRIFDRTLVFGQINCSCTKEIEALEYLVECEPVRTRCGLFGVVCGKVSIRGILDVITTGSFLTGEFCFADVSINDRELSDDLCLSYGPNLLGVVFGAFGVSSIFISIFEIIVTILDFFIIGSGPSEEEKSEYSDLMKFKEESMPSKGSKFMSKFRRKPIQDKCQGKVGGIKCNSCSVCTSNGVKGLTFDCTNIDPDLVSSTCTSVVNDLFAGILPKFGRS